LVSIETGRGSKSSGLDVEHTLLVAMLGCKQKLRHAVNDNLGLEDI
jgi:hypothetical protein